jgi:hypothetical protein
MRFEPLYIFPRLNLFFNFFRQRFFYNEIDTGYFKADSNFISLYFVLDIFKMF